MNAATRKGHSYGDKRHSLESTWNKVRAVIATEANSESFVSGF